MQFGGRDVLHELETVFVMREDERDFGVRVLFVRHHQREGVLCGRHRKGRSAQGTDDCHLIFRQIRVEIVPCSRNLQRDDHALRDAEAVADPFLRPCLDGMPVRMAEIQNLAKAFFTEVLMDDIRLRLGGHRGDFRDERQITVDQSFQIFLNESREIAMADDSGLEIDYIPGLLEDFAPLVEKGGLEYTIGSVHLIPQPESIGYIRSHPTEAADYLWMIDGAKYERYDEGLQRLFGGDIKRGVRAFFEQNNCMIESQRPTIVGHFDKIVMNNKDRYFHYDEKWFLDLVYETVQLIHETGCICEVNTRGIYKGRHYDFYPARQTLRHMNTLGIPVIVSTDAHLPEDLLHTEGAFEFLEEIGYRNVLSNPFTA